MRLLHHSDDNLKRSEADFYEKIRGWGHGDISVILKDLWVCMYMRVYTHTHMEIYYGMIYYGMIILYLIY